MTEPVGSGSPPPRDPRELEEAGPALRIREELFPGSEFTGRTLHVDGLPDDVAPADRRSGARPDALLGGLGAGALLGAAGFAFLASGAQRADGLLQALGVVLVGLAIAGAAVGVYLARSD